MSQQSLDEAVTDASTTESPDDTAFSGRPRARQATPEVSDDTVGASVGQAYDATMEVPVEVGEFTHREVPNGETTKWKRVWGEPAVDEYPQVTTEVSISTATSEHWKVGRSHNTYEKKRASGPVASFRRMQGDDIGQATVWNVVDSETLVDDLPSREAALQVAIEYMRCASTISSIVPPGISEAKAKAYCELYHPDHPVADLTVADQNKLLERENPEAEQPIEHRLETMLEDGLYEHKTKPAEEFVTDKADSMMAAFREIESWQAKGFEVDVRMPATHSIHLSHPEHGERFKIHEVSRRGRSDKYCIGATIRGEFVEQSTRDAPSSIAVAVEKVNRLIQAEIGNERYYTR